MPKQNILFLTLRVFSATGGIEKVCKVAGKAMHELCSDNPGTSLQVLSLYDEPTENSSQYFPATIFKGFGRARAKFLLAAFGKRNKVQTVVVSHVNLLLVGVIIKMFAPQVRLVLIAHGIEVWRRFPAWKKMMLQECDAILPVSDFTKQTMVTLYQLPVKKFTTLNNCLDPFLPLPAYNEKEETLLTRYKFTTTTKVLLTLTRIATNEGYKGYDEVIRAIAGLKTAYPELRYLLVGKYDAKEKARLDEIIDSLQLKDFIVFTGFIPDEELEAHYDLADVYIMPSRKEGFGIVFIEALFYGKPVIAGNIDGSVDALKNGKFGLLVNPNSQEEITAAIIEMISHPIKYIPLHEEVMEHFSFKTYKENIRKFLTTLCVAASVYLPKAFWLVSPFAE